MRTVSVKMRPAWCYFGLIRVWGLLRFGDGWRERGWIGSESGVRSEADGFEIEAGYDGIWRGWIHGGGIGAGMCVLRGWWDIVITR